MILHVIHSSEATRCCWVLSVGSVVGIIEAPGEDIVVVTVTVAERISSASSSSSGIADNATRRLDVYFFKSEPSCWNCCKTQMLTQKKTIQAPREVYLGFLPRSTPQLLFKVVAGVFRFLFTAVSLPVTAVSAPQTERHETCNAVLL